MKKDLKSILSTLEKIEETDQGQLQGGFVSITIDANAVNFSGNVNNCRGGTCKINNCSGGNCTVGCGGTE